ncbi:phage integrase family protein [Azohydromonas caseinilytica]|uniref:Tyrosine-type recombinase/integrase n=1 Tax=Azohydromonas caseinilytica TaxID=2728836 RepID=A0A848FH72_9BURK|nr:phage integrase family protein [Azohydromonas caseinilytica]NML18612.1 tyrosine-type recombinase/integrase [Azohydromonas caseinilytica]
MLREEQALGVHHFAFLRSWLQGLDLRRAWERYLAFGELSADLRRIERQRGALLRRVLRDGHALNLGLPESERITAELQVLAQPPRGPGAVALPDLDEFIDSQGLDRETHSEAELLREYREFYGLDGVETLPAHREAGSDRSGLAARSLRRIEALLARRPAPPDRVALWLSPAMAERLTAAGIGTLAALVQTVNVFGPNWWRRVQGLGRARADRLLEWLQPLARDWEEPLRSDAREAPQRRIALRTGALGAVQLLPRFALVPLEQLAVPPRLAGGVQAPGLFATRMPNHLGAEDDRQAIEAWLAQYREKPATLRAYRKEVERFYLWCLLERGKALSSVDSRDAQAYREFIRQPPPAWCGAAVVARDDPAWRPFRGPLKPASQRQALVVVQALFDGLRDANYLVGNPLRAVSKKAALVGSHIDIERSFTEAEWAFVRAQLGLEEAAARPRAGVPRGAEQRRLRLVLELLAATGLRLSEIAGATLASVRSVRLDAAGEDATLLSVQGKGGKVREVPLAEDLAALLAAHHADAAAVAPLPSPTPLVCTLAEAPPRWRALADGSLGLERPAITRALGASGLYRMLKRFFTRIAARAHAVDGLDAARLRAASTHWLRHTFARQGAAAQIPVEVLQQALGHASLSTTTIYLGTERVRMVREFEKLKRRRKPE